MASPNRAATRPPAGAYRFEPFEADMRRSELRKFGIRVRLERKPWQVLVTLLEATGRVVAREELVRHLWGGDVFVDFEHGLNVAVQKLREALGDSADQPHFIETVSGEGYRFIAAVQRVGAAVSERKEPTQPSDPAIQLAVPDAGSVAERSTRIPSRIYVWSLAFAALALIVAVGVFAWKRIHRPELLLNGSGWILIANFDNRTGQPVLDGSLEHALERELSNSQFVKVVPRDRVEDTLRLMKKPRDATLDRALGREVCLRDGDIQALITGRVEKLGTTYVLSAEIVNPATGVTSASFTEEDPQDSQLAGAVLRLSGHVRKALGENPHLVQQSLETLERVTTPSLRALRLFSQADRLMTNADAAAAELLEEAVKEDPNFASAHLYLAYAYGNLGQVENSKFHLQRAFQLADTVPERERLWITAEHYRKENQLQKAAEAYETLLRLYPDHEWGYSNLRGIYLQLGRFDDAVQITGRASDLRPHDLHQAMMAARQLTLAATWGPARPTPEENRRRLEKALTYDKRMQALLNAQTDDASRDDIAWSRIVLAWQQLELGQVAEADLEFQQARSLHQQRDDGFEWDLAKLAMVLGHLHEAGEIAANVSPLDPFYPPLGQAVVAFYRGDLAAARQQLRRLPKTLPNGAADNGVAEDTALMMIPLGMLREASDLGRRMSALDEKEDRPNRRGSMTIKGQLALAKGETKIGTSILEQNLRYCDERRTATARVYESLADAYRKQHKPDDALRVLQEGASYWGTPGNFSPAYRMRVRLKLADLYRELGRTSDAEKIEAGLRQELMFADADHPILVALQHRKGSNVSGEQTNTVASTATK